MQEELWTQRDGTKIAVGDMSEAHVRNALRMLIRWSRTSAEDSDRAEMEREDAIWRSIYGSPGSHGSD